MREKTTDAFDTKVNYTLSEKNQLSYRLSFQRPVVFDPGPVRRVRRPGQRRVRRHRHEQELQHGRQLDARLQHARLVMDVRGGVNYYHNVAHLAGPRPDDRAPTSASPARTSTSSRAACRAFTIGGYTAPVLGLLAQPALGPLRETWNVATTVTKLVRNHTVKLGGEWRHNRDMLLQTQDAGGSRGRFNFNASGTGLPSESAIAQRRRQLVRRRSCSTGRTACTRDLKVIDEPGTQALGDLPLHAGQVAGAAERHHRPRPALGVLHAADGPRGRRQPVELRPGDQHAARRPASATRRRLNVKNTFTNFNPRTGVSVAA